MASNKGTPSASFITKGTSFVSDSVDELKKVTSPTRQETIQATMVTMIIVFVVAISLFILDLIFGKLMTAVLS